MYYATSKLAGFEFGDLVKAIMTAFLAEGGRQILARYLNYQR